MRFLPGTLALLLALLIAWPIDVAQAKPRKKRRRPPSSPPPTLVVPEEPALPPAPEASAEAEPQDADIVETIDMGDTGDTGDTGTSPTPAPPPSTPPWERFQFRGWAKVGLSLGGSKLGIDSPTDPLAVRREWWTNQEQLFLRLRVERERMFEAVVAGTMTHGVYIAESRPQEVEERRSSFSATLLEAHAGWFWQKLDLRVGLQRIAWGKGDAFAPNDILNPWDQRDPVFLETETSRLPVFAIRADIALGRASLEGLVLPFFRPNRFDVYGSNWALIQDDAPILFRSLFGLVDRVVDRSLRDELMPVVMQVERPRDDFSDTSAAARLRWRAGDFDFSHYLHYGFDDRPLYSIDPQAAAALSTVDFSALKAADLAPLLLLIDQGKKPISGRYLRRIHVGADAETTFGSLVLRFDGAFTSRHVFARRQDFTGETHGALQAVLAVEHQPGDMGKLFLVEASYLRLLDHEDSKHLLGFRRDNLALAALWQWTFLRERLELEARGTVSVRPFAFVARPEIGWKWKETAVSVRLGALLLGGEEGTTPHYFRKNRSVYVHARYAF
ncbi:MAG: hypothetical protein HY698_00155 [Deltaproteobacteria bacterium]|nr:hypothetical protein [Deltaproteobacteria bacterium]